MTCTLTATRQTHTLFTRSYDQLRNTQSISMRLHDSANYGGSFPIRGNLSNWSEIGGNSGTATSNIGGQVTASTANGVNTTTTYNAAYSAPSVITTNSNAQIQTTLTFNSFLGLTNASQANGTSVAATYDTYARPQTQTTPDGTVTLTYANSPPMRTATLGTRWTKTYFDGLGRTIKEETGDGSGTKSIVDTVYEPCSCSPMGKVKKVSRPYAPGGTPVWTEYTYEALGRALSVIQPGNTGTTTYVYSGNTVAVTGPSGKWKKFTTDAFGNLVQVNEPNPAGGADYVTTYTYNGFGKLTSVVMPRPKGTQTRTFTYTGTFLSSETHPESGTTSYTGGGGLIGSRTDANGHRTEYSYDTYRRLTLEKHYNSLNQEIPCERVTYRYDTYSVTPPAGYGGNNAWGRRSEAEWGNENPAVCGAGLFKEQYRYDQWGQQSSRTIRFRRNDPNRPTSGTVGPNRGEAVLTASWAWFGGRIVSVTYPWTQHVSQPSAICCPDASYAVTVAGQEVEHLFDTMMRPNGLRMRPASWEPWQTLVSGVTYGVAGEMTQVQYGGQTETRGYNLLGQLTAISYNGTLRHEYRYSATQNDGQITQYKNWQSGEEVSYQYDTLGRMTRAETTGPQWGQSFGYDGFGNLVSKAVIKGSAPVLNVTADAATNRIVAAGLTYYPNGTVANMPGVGQMVYDGRNRFVGTTAGTLKRGYDPANRKLWTDQGGEIYLDFYLPTGGKIGTYQTFLHNGHGSSPPPTGEVCNRPGNAGYCISFRKIVEFTYFSGRRIHTNSSVPTWHYPDRLDNQGKFPYGDETGRFATYDQDAGGLHYAMNRYYSSTYGRFLSPDPYRASGGPADPGSWNRYVYVMGDPVNQIDPSGLCTIGGIVYPDGQPPCPNVTSVTVTDGFLLIGGSGGSGYSTPGEIPIEHQSAMLFGRPGADPPLPKPPGEPGSGGGGGGGQSRSKFTGERISNKTQASKLAREAIDSIKRLCLNKLGVSRDVLQKKADALRYWDGRPSEEGNVRIADFLPEVQVRPGETFNSVSYGFNAVTLPHETGLSNNIVLGSNFWLESRTGTDQAATLVHELLHVHFQRADVAIAQRFMGYDGSNSEEAGMAITKWVKDCLQ